MSYDLIMNVLSQTHQKVTEMETYLQNMHTEFHAVRGKIIGYKELMADLHSRLAELKEESTEEQQQ